MYVDIHIYIYIDIHTIIWFSLAAATLHAKQWRVTHPASQPASSIHSYIHGDTDHHSLGQPIRCCPCSLFFVVGIYVVYCVRSQSACWFHVIHKNVHASKPYGVHSRSTADLRWRWRRCRRWRWLRCDCQCDTSAMNRADAACTKVDSSYIYVCVCAMCMWMEGVGGASGIECCWWGAVSVCMCALIIKYSQYRIFCALAAFCHIRCWWRCCCCYLCCLLNSLLICMLRRNLQRWHIHA